MALNDREKMFVLQYIKLGEAYPAALESGYAESTANIASDWINPEIMKNHDEKRRKRFKPEVYAAIQEKMEGIASPVIADAQEVLEYLTSVMRKEAVSYVLARDETGADRVIEKRPDEKEALKAGELLGKRYGLYTDKVQADIVVPVFKDDVTE